MVVVILRDNKGKVLKEEKMSKNVLVKKKAIHRQTNFAQPDNKRADKRKLELIKNLETSFRTLRKLS